MKTKYNITFAKLAIEKNINRLTNQLWKLIPMRENSENWQEHLVTVLLEVVGLNELFREQSEFLTLLSKLEGLRYFNTDFALYRKTVFESISLLRSLINNE